MSDLTMILHSKADAIRKEYQLAYSRPCDCSTPDSALHYGRAQGLEIAADIAGADPSPAVTLQVKKLQWRPGYCSEEVTISQATTLGGLYQVRVLHGEVWLDKPGSKSVFPSTDAAIAAAQADYESLILSCIFDPSPEARAGQ